MFDYAAYLSYNNQKNLAKAIKKKSAGRPAGVGNVKIQYLRDEICTQFRCSRGCNEVIKELVATGMYASKADVLHEALQILAMRKLPADFYWREKIQ